MEVGTKVYVQYRGSQYYAEVTEYDFPYYVVELSNGLEIRVYQDELVRA